MAEGRPHHAAFDAEKKPSGSSPPAHALLSWEFYTNGAFTDAHVELGDAATMAATILF